MRAEKTTKEAAADIVRATRALREQEGHKIPKTNSGRFKRCLFLGSCDPPGAGRRPASPGGSRQPSRRSLRPPRDIVFSAHGETPVTTNDTYGSPEGLRYRF